MSSQVITASVETPDCEETFYVKQLQTIIDQEKKEHGLVCFQLFPAANKDSSINDIAREAVAMHGAFLSGNCTDITQTV